LWPVIDTVKRLNARKLALLKGNKKVLRLAKSANINHAQAREYEVPVKMLQALEPYNVLPGKLKVKLGCPLITMQSLSI
jgi:hypothetical protein